MHRYLFSLVLAMVLLGCESAREASNDNPTVVATTSMIADLASVLGGPHVEVSGLMGPGVDPHLFKASEGDMTRMARANVILYNGLHLEGKMADIFEQMAARGIRAVALAEVAIPKDRLIESDQFAGNYDPHVWFDVQLWSDVARATADILRELRPEQASSIDSSLTRYLGSLDSLDAYIRQMVANVPEDRRVIVTSHDAFGYFGRAYGFEVRGLQGISTATEAGTADVQELANFVAERRIPALFVESSVSPRGIQAVREAVRARGFEVKNGGTLYGDALGDPGTPAGTYIGMMRHNVETIVSSLNPKPAADEATISATTASAPANATEPRL